jgi:hypothetical protein
MLRITIKLIKNFIAYDWDVQLVQTGHFIMLSVITNIYNKKTKGPTLMELFTVTEKLKKVF